MRNLTTTMLGLVVLMIIGCGYVATCPASGADTGISDSGDSGADPGDTGADAFDTALPAEAGL